MDEIDIEHVAERSLSDPVLIEGLPGVGHIGKLVAEHLIEEFESECVRRVGRGLRPNDTLRVHVNQARRSAWVLAVLGEEALVEYELPSEATALTIVPALIAGKGPVMASGSASYRRLPRRWIEAVRAGAGSWEGRSRTGDVPFPPTGAGRD